MNTIRRTIKTERNNSQVEISFEGEKGEFLLLLERFNPYEGTSRIFTQLSPEQAQVLYKSLGRFLNIQ